MLTLKRLERSEAKVSRYVLMGRGCSNVVLLPTYNNLHALEYSLSKQQMTKYLIE